MRIRKTIFGTQKYFEPNTFIGGVSGTITSASILATKLGLAVNRIKGFRIDGSNIHAQISGNYSIPNSAFKGDPSIKYFNDLDGLVINLRAECFMNSAIESFIFNNVSGVENRAFRGAKVYEIFLPSMITNITNPVNFQRGIFDQMPNLTKVNISNFNGNMLDWFNGDSNLVEINVGSGRLSYGGTFTGTGILNYMSPYDKILEGSTFFGGTCRAETLEFPNLTSIIMSWPIGGNIYQKFFIAPNLEYIEVPNSVGAFGSTTSLGNAYLLIDIPQCKTILGNPFYNGLRLNSTEIRVHINLFTSNDGNPNSSLLYAKNTRGATVNFYDDNGNYVSTL